MSWLAQLVGRIVSTSSYPLPVGSQNRDGFERNHDNPLHGLDHSARILRLSAVWACVRLLAETISTLPIGVYEYTATGRKPAREFWLFELVHDMPNAAMTAQSFWEAYLGSLLLHGDAYAEKRRGTQRQIASLHFMQCERLTFDKTRRVYTYKFDNGTSREIAEVDVFHTVGFSLDGETGLSPISYGASVFYSALSSDMAANRTFRNGLMPTIAFSMEQVLKKDQRAEFRDNFVSELGGAVNAGKSPLLEGGMKAFPLGINPRDAQLLESRAWSIEEICRWFRVPPFMVGHSEKSTSWGTGLEQQNIGFLTYALRPWLTRIEQSIRKDLLTPVERAKYFAEFSVEGLLRADSAARASYLSQMTQNGLMTRDEARAYDNREPVGGNAAVLTVQSNLAPLDKLGQTAPPAAAAGDALKAWLGIESEKPA